jgi:GNAT superfamily N-acetyltransferase
MSVAAHLQRHGIGRRLLQHLVAHAKARGYRHVILETTATWHEVIAFYQQQGFRSPIIVMEACTLCWTCEALQDNPQTQGTDTMA